MNRLMLIATFLCASGCAAMKLELPNELAHRTKKQRVEGTTGYNPFTKLAFGGHKATSITYDKVEVREPTSGSDGHKCARVFRFAFTDASGKAWNVRCKAESKHSKEIGWANKYREGLRCRVTAADDSSEFVMVLKGETGRLLKGPVTGLPSGMTVESNKTLFVRLGYIFRNETIPVAAVQFSPPPTVYVGDRLSPELAGPVGALTAALLIYQEAGRVYHLSQCEIQDEG